MDEAEVWDGEGCLDRVKAARLAIEKGVADTVHLEGDKMNKLNDELAMEVVEVLKGAEALTHLDFSLNELTDATATQIAKALDGHKAVQNLELDGNKLTDSAASAMADLLRAGSSLTRLDLSGNTGIGNEGAKKLADALKLNTTLESLHIRSCSIGSEGVQALCETLSGNNTTLLGLYMSGNLIDDSAVPALVKLMRNNTTLTELGLANNSLSDKAVDRLIQEGLSENYFLLSLHLSTQGGKRVRNDKLEERIRRNRKMTQDRQTPIHQVRQMYEAKIADLEAKHAQEVAALEAKIAELRK
eukprot:Hpha_TRINITY_DN12534_c0_g1::TRINITY_DN12534_c0_g1_i1::g.51205::m.51205